MSTLLEQFNKVSPEEQEIFTREFLTSFCEANGIILTKKEAAVYGKALDNMSDAAISGDMETAKIFSRLIEKNLDMKSKVGVWGQEKAAPITRDSILLVGKKVSEVVLTVSEWTADAAYKAIHKASGMLIKEPVVEAVVEAVEINI